MVAANARAQATGLPRGAKLGHTNAYGFLSKALATLDRPVAHHAELKKNDFANEARAE